MKGGDPQSKKKASNLSVCAGLQEQKGRKGGNGRATFVQRLASVRLHESNQREAAETLPYLWSPQNNLQMGRKGTWVVEGRCWLLCLTTLVPWVTLLGLLDHPIADSVVHHSGHSGLAEKLNGLMPS